MSLPIDYNSYSDENPSVFTRMLSQPERYEDMNPSERKGADEKINEFEKYLEEELKEYLESYNDNEIDDNFIADEVNLQNSEKNNIVNFYYFIGRLNPPHDGHIYALTKLVEKAKQDKCKALILLGSGPTPKGGDDKRTMDNPISFKTKKAFIISKLNEISAIEDKDYLIQEMTTPFADVSRYIGSYFINNDNVDNNTEITITHIAGGKDDDATKLSSVLVHASNVASQNAPNAKVSTNIETIEPQPSTTGNEAMSATQVRKSVYRNYLDGNGFDSWEPRYKNFYGGLAPTIYEEILHPVRKLEDIKKDEQIIRTDIEKYIENGTLPKYTEQKNKKQKTTKKTGGTSKKHTKTKTKNKRNGKKYTRRNKKIL